MPYPIAAARGKGSPKEEATTNLFTNPSIEVDTTGWGAEDATLSSDTAYSMFGDAALKIVTDDIGGTEGTKCIVTAQTAADTEYTFSVYLRGSGTVWLWVWDDNGATQWGTEITLTGVWTRHSITKTFSDGANRRLGVYTRVQQDITFYCDGLQLEEQDYATSYCDGSLGPGYAWTGAAHASTSIRT